MKIGILTLPLHTNYGGILQAYALQTVLERMGHNVEVIDKSRYHFLPFYKKPFAYAYRFLKKLILRRHYRICFEKDYNKCLDRDIVTQVYTRPFIEKHVHLRHIEKFSEIKEHDYDTIVVGSDQIWRAVYARSMLQSVTAPYLDFTKKWKNLKRVSYAASFGTDTWEYSDKDTKKCRKFIQKFDAVSVREKNGIKLCDEFLNFKRAVHVLDPTLLLDRSDYESLIPSNQKKSKGNLLCYIMDDSTEKRKLIDDIAKTKRLTPFSVNSKVDDRNAPLEDRIQPSVEQWIQGFKDADFVVTDSFHACVFSIIFRKTFVVVGNIGRGLSRFQSFLEMFGLESRLVLNVEKCEANIFDSIDYDDVYKRLDKYKNESISFLKKWLS